MLVLLLCAHSHAEKHPVDRANIVVINNIIKLSTYLRIQC